MSNKLSGKKIALLATDGFEQVELTKPWDAIKSEGAEVVLVSLESGEIQGVNHDEKADKFTIDNTVDEVAASDFNGLVFPGGVFNSVDLPAFCDKAIEEFCEGKHSQQNA